MGVDTQKFLVLGYSLDLINKSILGIAEKSAIKEELRMPNSWISKNKKYKDIINVFCIDYYCQDYLEDDQEEPLSNFVIGIAMGEELNNGLECVEEKEIDSNVELLASMFKKKPYLYLIQQFS